MLRLSGLPETLTIDELATMTESEMVRRRFDAGNTRYLTALSTMAVVTSIFQVAIATFGTKAGYQLPVSILHLLVAGVASVAMWKLIRHRRNTAALSAPLQIVARNITPWILAFLITEFAILTAFRRPSSNAWLIWAHMYPWFLIGVRLEISRRIALHAALIGICVVNAVVSVASHVSNIPPYVGAFVVSAAALFIGAVASRRVARQTIDEWSERRAQARDQLRMRDELQYAREVQLSMLPESAPSVAWVDLAGASLPATEVGGDYYDYFVDAGAVTVVCGDVAGHGLGSGIVLASLRSGFMLLRDSLHDPAVVLQRLNDLVEQTSRRRMLATAAVLRLDESTRHATVASAGHPPLMIRRERDVRVLELFAPPLGVRLPFRVPAADLAFSSGDVFVLHSDGVYESQSPAGETYGLDRLSNLLAEVDGASAASIRDAIIRDVESFRGGAPQQDDVTVVVAKIV